MPVTIDGNGRAAEFMSNFLGGKAFEDLHLDNGSDLGFDCGEAGKQIFDLDDGGVAVQAKSLPQRDLLTLTRKRTSVVNEQPLHDLARQGEKSRSFVIPVPVVWLKGLDFD